LSIKKNGIIDIHIFRQEKPAITFLFIAIFVAVIENFPLYRGHTGKKIEIKPGMPKK
jgi:hypothetical protein